MKVFHIITDTNIGGAGRYLLNLLDQPAFDDLEVLVACPGGELAKRIDAKGWKRINISGKDVSFSVKLIPELLRIMKEERVDVVHTHSSLSGRIAARLCGIPVVYTKHNLVRIPNAKGHVPPKAGPFKRAINRLVSKMLSDAVIGVSQGVYDELVECGIPQDMVVAIPNGIDLRPFKPKREEKTGATKRTTLVGTVARLHRQKALDVMLEAAKVVLSAEPNTRFVIGGTGPLEDELKSKIKELRLEPYVKMAGFVSDVPAFLRDLDIYVLSSDYEGLPLATLEAMAAYLPVVATAVGGVPEAVVDGETGILVPPRQPRVLAQAIVRLVVDPNMAAKMGQKGRRRLEELFDAKVMAKRTVEVYRTVTEKKRPRRSS